jgi:hypothetical protein
MISKITLRSLVVSTVLILFLLAACSTPATPTATVEVTSTQAPEAVATPTATPEPAVVWLITGASSETVMGEQFSAFLNERAPIDNFTLEVRETFSQDGIPGDLQIAVFLSPGEDVVTLAADHPDTQFVVISDHDLTPASNLSVIRAAETQAAFLAGYIATLNAPDFRSGALLVDGTVNTAQTQDSFLNGGRYFCGRCAPVFAPIVLFPQVGLVPAGADAAGWQTAFDTLNQNFIETLYVPAEGLLPEFLTYLAGKNVGVISNAPPPASSKAIWIATVQSDLVAALAGIWPALTAGEGGKTVPASLVLTHVNGENLSPGRQKLAERIIPGLISGVISPLSVP